MRPNPISASLICGAVALGAITAACSDSGSTLPARRAPGAVQFSLAVQVAAAGKALQVTINYQRAGSSTPIPLLDQRLEIGTDVRTVPLSVDIAPCVADPQ